MTAHDAALVGLLSRSSHPSGGLVFPRLHIRNPLEFGRRSAFENTPRASRSNEPRPGGRTIGGSRTRPEEVAYRAPGERARLHQRLTRAEASSGSRTCRRPESFVRASAAMSAGQKEIRHGGRNATAGGTRQRAKNRTSSIRFAAGHGLLPGMEGNNSSRHRLPRGPCGDLRANIAGECAADLNDNFRTGRVLCAERSVSSEPLFSDGDKRARDSGGIIDCTRRRVHGAPARLSETRRAEAFSFGPRRRQSSPGARRSLPDGFTSLRWADRALERKPRPSFRVCYLCVASITDWRARAS